MIEMVGTEATWANFAFREEDRDFQRWARSDAEGPLPPLTPDTKINCWEMVLYAALTAKPPVLTHADVHEMYRYKERKDGSPPKKWYRRLADLLVAPNKRKEYTAVDPASPQPRTGDVVLWNGTDHVALATGRLHEDGSPEVISFWPPPGEHRPGEIKNHKKKQTWARRDVVKRSSIDELYKYMMNPPSPDRRENYLNKEGQVIVEFGPGPW